MLTNRNSLNGTEIVIGGTIDIPIQIELDGNRRTAQGADGRNFRHTRYLTEAAFQRCGDGGGDRSGISAREVCLDSDHGKVHTRDRCYGQKLVSNDPGQEEPSRQQRRASRAADEGLGDAHGWALKR